MNRTSTIGRPGLFLIVSVLALGCGGDDGAADAAIPDTGAGGDSGSIADSAVPPDTGPASDSGGAADSGAATDSGDPADSGMPSDSSVPSDALPPPNGAFRFLSYNVAGLPDAISGSDPATNTPLMSPLLNAYEIVVAQEDFTYHADLIGAAVHAHISAPSAAPPGRTFGDGLGRLSTFSFSGLEHVQWDECNGIIGSGTDCLAGKGFTMASHQIATGVEVHVYNLHMDAGRGGSDRAARADQIRQLLAYLAARSASATVIVAGDTNLKADDEAAVVDLLSMGTLTDACRELSCPDPSGHDRVMFRNAPGIELTPTLWQEDPRFVDGSGDALSDHPAIGVDFNWRLTSVP